MNIHEYQAKKILKEYEIPISKGFLISSLEDVKKHKKEFSENFYVVKSQIHAGGRGNGRFKELPFNAKGGIRLCSSFDEIVSNVSEILGKTLITDQTGSSGKKVNFVYVEEASFILNELYLSLTIDRKYGQVTFLAAKNGGTEIEKNSKNHSLSIKKIPINFRNGIKDKDIETLIKSLNIQNHLIDDASRLFRTLYRAFIEKDMSLLEINPLAIMKNGQLRILDVKMSFDDNALFRHPDISSLRDFSEENPKEIEASKNNLSYVSLNGNIGCMVNGAGLAMATMDIIKIYGEEPANFLDVGGNATENKVKVAFKIISEDKNVKGILVNIFGGIMRCDVIAKGIISSIQQNKLKVPLVVRLEGTNLKKGKKILEDSDLDIISANDLDDAAKKITSIIKRV